MLDGRIYVILLLYSAKDEDMQSETHRQRLANMARQYVGQGCVTATPIPQVRVIYAEEHCVRRPVMYDPSIVIIFQGHKVGYMGEKTFRYDPENYLLMTVPLPFECETFATPEHPLIGLSIRMESAMLQDLLMDLGDDECPDRPRADITGVCSVPLYDKMLCAAERLLEAMASPRDARVLGPGIVREIIYYVLCGVGGAALQAVVNRHTHFSQIARALRRIEHDYADSLNVEQLAADVNMSVSAFHHNFKAVTNTSPLQYLKSYRLHKARIMMLHGGLKAGAAALQVGYESPSQFSREFKRYFGTTPGDEVVRLRSGRALVEGN